MKVDVGKAIANSWNKAKPKVYAFATRDSVPSKPLVAEAKKLGGKSGADIARMVSLGGVKPDIDLYVFELRLPIEADVVQKLVSKSGISFYAVSKSAKLSKVGVLRGDEKLKPGYLRKKPAAPVVWSVNSKRGPEFDQKAMTLIRQQATLEQWVKDGRILGRVIAASRPDKDGKAGTFTHARHIANKTPEQLEKILGFRKGKFADGVKVFTAKTSQLSISSVDFRGYTNTPNGKPTDFKSMTDAEIKKKLETMPYPPGTGVIQIIVTKPLSVTHVTKSGVIGYGDKIKL